MHLVTCCREVADGAFPADMPGRGAHVFDFINMENKNKVESDRFTIQLNIANKLYPVTVNRENEAVYRKAAKLIQQKLDRYTSSFYAEDKQDYHAMVMLDLAVALVSEFEVDDKLQLLVDKIDGCLD